MKKIIISILTFVLLICAAALIGCGDGNQGPSSQPDTYTESLIFELTDDGNSYVVRGIKNKYLTSVIIPAEYNGKSVTRIDFFAFANCSKLTSIEIPNTITSIGDIAFRGCDLLKYNIKDGLKYLGNKDNPYLCLIETESKDITSAIIVDNCKVIGDYAFSRCSLLTSMFIPDSVVSIGEDAIRECTSLTSVIIGNSVKNIGDRAFGDCSSLTNVVLGNSVANLGFRVFLRCSSLKSIIVSENNTKYKSIDGNLYSKDGKVLVQYAPGKTDATFTTPNGVTTIAKDAFFNCSSLTSVVISNNVTTIENQAFFSCESLTNIEIPNSIIYLGNYVFSSCKALKYNIKDGLKYLGNKDNPYVCLIDTENKYTSAIIVDNCKVIGSESFLGYSCLTSVRIPDTVIFIGDNAFRNCDSLTSIEIPKSVTHIGKGAFSYCDLLTNIIVSEDNQNYKSIDGNLYSKDGKILVQYATGKTDTSFSSSSNVTTIAPKAFSGCKALTIVVISDSVTSIGNDALCDCTSLTNVVIGNSVISIGARAFRDCTSLANVVISNSVTSIGEEAFYNCNFLTTVYYKGTAREWYSIAINSYNDDLEDATRYYYSES